MIISLVFVLLLYIRTGRGVGTLGNARRIRSVIRGSSKTASLLSVFLSLTDNGIKIERESERETDRYEEHIAIWIWLSPAEIILGAVQFGSARFSGESAGGNERATDVFETKVVQREPGWPSPSQVAAAEGPATRRTRGQITRA